jgi:Fe2+ transport system protein FeoA
MTADSISSRDFFEIVALDENETGQRLSEIGFWPGKNIKLVLSAPFGDPLAFEVDNTVIALRKEEAKSIKVKTSAA